MLLENGRKDEIVPQSALKNIVRAAPASTVVHWYAAPHELNKAAYHDAFEWLARKARAICRTLRRGNRTDVSSGAGAARGSRDPRTPASLQLYAITCSNSSW